jgi:hypothetical protein
LAQEVSSSLRLNFAPGQPIKNATLIRNGTVFIVEVEAGTRKAAFELLEIQIK